MWKKIILSSVLFSASLVSYVAAWAATSTVVNNLPNVVDPGQVQKRLRTQPAESAVGFSPMIKPPALQHVTPPEFAKIKFKLNGVVFDGVTVYPQKTLLGIFAPYLNKDISLATLQKLIDAVTNKYRNDGYIICKAILPPQKISNGIVRIQVIEGYVSQVVVQGKPGRSKYLLEKYGERIAESRPLQMQTLERYLLLANDVPGVQVNAVLRPSQTVPGSAELDLVTQQKKIDGGLSYDNYGTRYLGPQETTASVSVNSLIRSGDTTSFRFLTTNNPRETNYLELIHSEPIGSNGTRWQLGGSYTQTHPGSLLETSDISGRSKALFGDLSYPVIRQRNKNWIIHGGFNYLDSYTSLLGIPFYFDRLRSLQLGSYYSFADSWYGSNFFNFEGERGFPILGASNSGIHSRPDGRVNFTKFNFMASRTQALTRRFSLYGAVKGQYSFVPLLVAEQFGFGGPDFGRGYDPSEILGDRGLDGKLELRMATEPDLWVLRTVQYYVFYDAGVIWNINTNGQVGKASATSAGVGARLYFTKGFSSNVYLAKPLTRPVATAVAVGEDGHGVRGFFQMAFNF